MKTLSQMITELKQENQQELAKIDTKLELKCSTDSSGVYFNGSTSKASSSVETNKVTAETMYFELVPKYELNETIESDMAVSFNNSKGAFVAFGANSGALDNEVITVSSGLYKNTGYSGFVIPANEVAKIVIRWNPENVHYDCYVNGVKTTPQPRNEEHSQKLLIEKLDLGFRENLDDFYAEMVLNEAIFSSKQITENDAKDISQGRNFASLHLDNTNSEIIYNKNSYLDQETITVLDNLGSLNGEYDLAATDLSRIVSGEKTSIVDGVGNEICFKPTVVYDAKGIQGPDLGYGDGINIPGSSTIKETVGVNISDGDTIKIHSTLNYDGVKTTNQIFVHEFQVNKNSSDDSNYGAFVLNIEDVTTAGLAGYMPIVKEGSISFYKGMNNTGFINDWYIIKIEKI